MNQSFKSLCGEFQQHAVFVRDDIDGTRSLIEQRNFTEALATRHGGKNRFFSFDDGQGPEFPFEDDKHRVSVISFANDMAKLSKPHRLEIMAQRLKLRVVPFREELYPSQRRGVDVAIAGARAMAVFGLFHAEQILDRQPPTDN